MDVSTYFRKSVSLQVAWKSSNGWASTWRATTVTGLHINTNDPKNVTIAAYLHACCYARGNHLWLELSVLVSHEFKTEKSNLPQKTTTLKCINRTSVFVCVHNLLVSVDAASMTTQHNTTVGCVVLLQVKCPITGTFSPLSYNMLLKIKTVQFSLMNLHSLTYCIVQTEFHSFGGLAENVLPPIQPDGEDQAEGLQERL